MLVRQWIPLIVLPVALAGIPGAAGARCDNSVGGGQVAGTLLGAVVGGLIGSQIGGGTGNKIAIGAGVLAGGLVGNRIGAALDCQEIERHQRTAADAFETRPTGTVSSWRNPDTGHAGSITPVKTYRRDDGVYCREFEQTITVNSRTERGYGTACRQPDGSWKIMG